MSLVRANEGNGLPLQVPPLHIAVQLLPCSVGDSLLPGWGSPDLPGGLTPWTSCQACGADQVGLWLDNRQQLQAATGPEQGAWDAGSVTSEQFNATVQALLGRGSGGATAGAATCRNCPAGAQCPGGAVLVPLPGWWHSAANATAFHRCPFPAACGGAGSADRPSSSWQPFSAAAHVPPTMAQASPRSRALAACQAAWYDSGWRPGLWVVAVAAARGLLGPWAGAGAPAALPPAALQEARLGGPQGEDIPCLLWYEPNLLADSALAVNGHGSSGSRSSVSQFAAGAEGRAGPSSRASRALHAGSQPGGPDGASKAQQQPPATWSGLSYTQLQCAEGYTGNLCAACQPGHYLQPGFECSPCPGVGRTLLLGLLAFGGSVALVLVVAAFSLGQQEDSSSSAATVPDADVVKVGAVVVRWQASLFGNNFGYPAVFACLVWWVCRCAGGRLWGKRGPYSCLASGPLGRRVGGGHGRGAARVW